MEGGPALGRDEPHSGHLDESGARRVILGTLNLISDDANPWQFEPPSSQPDAAPGCRSRSVGATSP